MAQRPVGVEGVKHQLACLCHGLKTFTQSCGVIPQHVPKNSRPQDIRLQAAALRSPKSGAGFSNSTAPASVLLTHSSSSLVPWQGYAYTWCYFTLSLCVGRLFGQSLLREAAQWCTSQGTHSSSSNHSIEHVKAPAKTRNSASETSRALMISCQCVGTCIFWL